MTGCGIATPFDLALFPKLTFFDATKTKLAFEGPASSTQAILTSNHTPPGPEFQRVSLRPFVSYATAKGHSETIDDIPFVRHRNGLNFYGLFSSRSGGITSTAVTRSIHSAIPTSVMFSDQDFAAIVNGFMTPYHENQLFDGTDFLFVMQLTQDLYIASLGTMELIGVDEKVSRIIDVMNPDRDVQRIFGSMFSDQMPSFRSNAEQLIYALDAVPTIHDVTLAADIRFLVFLPSSVISTLTYSLFLGLCRTSATARGLAYAIRNHAAALTIENVSVFVVDIAEEAKPIPLPERESSDSAAAVDTGKDEASTSSGDGEECQNEPIAPVIRARTMEETRTVLDYSDPPYSDEPAQDAIDIDEFTGGSTDLGLISDEFGSPKTSADLGITHLASDDVSPPDVDGSSGSFAMNQVVRPLTPDGGSPLDGDKTSEDPTEPGKS
jgi:hypothetical protein